MIHLWAAWTCNTTRLLGRLGFLERGWAIFIFIFIFLFLFFGSIPPFVEVTHHLIGLNELSHHDVFGTDEYLLKVHAASKAAASKAAAHAIVHTRDATHEIFIILGWISVLFVFVNPFAKVCLYKGRFELFLCKSWPELGL